MSQAPDGRYMLTGLKIGDGTQEVTSAMLREIRLSDIIALNFERTSHPIRLPS